MALKLFNIHLVLLLVSCSLSFDKEIINYGSILKSFDQIKIKKGETSKSFVIKKLGPPSFVNPYDSKNVFYISQKMKKEIGNINQFEEARFLEIFYNENDKVVDFNFKKEKLANNISLSKLNEKSVSDDRISFEVLRNIFSNLRRKSEN